MTIPQKPLNLSRGLKANAQASKVGPGLLDPNQRNVKPAAGDMHSQLTQKAQQWVAQTFFGTLLKQMDESPFKSEMLSGGKGGQAFSSMYHQRLVEHMSKASGKKLVEGMVRRIEAKRAKEAYDLQKVPPATPKGGNDSQHLPSNAKSGGLRQNAPARRAVMNLAA